HFIAIDRERSSSSFANAAAIVSEVERDSVLARGELFAADAARLALLLVGILIPVLVREGVGKHRFAVEHHQSPATEPTALSHKDAVGPTLRDFHIGGDMERLVLNVWGVPLRDANHAWVVDKIRASGVEAWAQCGVRPVGETGIKRQHVVLSRFNQ